MNDKKVKIGLIVAIILSSVVLIGVSYAFYRYEKIGTNSQLVTGDIYMHYNGGNSKNVSMTPSNTYRSNDYFEFTRDGKNTTTNDIVYEIVLNHGEDLNSPHIRLNDNYLRFRLVELNTNEEENVLIEETGFKSLNNTKLYVGRIAGGTNSEINKTFRLYTWVEGIIIGNVSEAEYTSDEWDNVYTNISVGVNGDFEEKTRDGSIRVTFNTVGGTLPITEKYYDVGDEYGELPTPIKLGYEFLGWYLEDTYENQVTSSSEISGTSNITLYAKWNMNGIMVLLNSNGGTSSGTESIMAINNSSHIVPEDITLPSKEYTVTGFGLDASRKSDGASVSDTSDITLTATFNGYYTAATGGEKVLKPSTVAKYVSENVNGYLENGKWVRNQGTTLYAQYSMSAVSLPTITKTGYTCGWTTSSSGTTITYPSGKNDFMPNSNMTLYGVCEVNAIDNVSFTAASSSIYISFNTGTSLTYDGDAETIAYASNNTSVATVDENGVITGVSDGTATITVTLTDYEGTITRRTLEITVVRVWAENLSYVPPIGVDDDDVQTILETVSCLVDDTTCDDSGDEGHGVVTPEPVDPEVPEYETDLPDNDDDDDVITPDPVDPDAPEYEIDLP